MKRILALAVALLAFPATASAELTVSPEKQAAMNTRGWTAVNDGSVVPVVTEYADGRACEKGRSGTALREANGTPAIKVWTSLQACARDNRIVSVTIDFGQGSSGAHWVRKTPFNYPWTDHGWVNRPEAYRSTGKAGFSYGGQQTWWYLMATIRGTARRGNDIVFKRDGRIH